MGVTCHFTIGQDRATCMLASEPVAVQQLKNVPLFARLAPSRWSCILAQLSAFPFSCHPSPSPKLSVSPVSFPGSLVIR